MRFNGIKKDYLRVNMELFRPPSPPIEYQGRPMTRGGERVTKRRFTGLELPVPVTIKSEQRTESLMRDISDWLIHDEPKRLEFSDSDKYYLAHYQGMDLRNVNPWYAKGTILFYLPVAYRFGQDESINVTTTNYHTITGQVETPWQLEVTFSAATNRFEFWAGDIYLQLNYNFIVGDRLTIRYTGREVWLRDRDLRPAVSMSSHFDELPVGEIGMSASHPCTLKYTERYY